MNLLKPKLFLSVTLILLITSVKCCIYSTDLAELGQTLLQNLKDTNFNDYDAVEDFKKSIEFALNSSIVATSAEIYELEFLAKIDTKDKYVLNATDAISDNFNIIFSLLTPYNNYNVEELENILDTVNIATLLKQSLSLYRRIFEKPAKLRRIIKTIESLPHADLCKQTTSIHHKLLGLHNRALLNIIMGFSSILYLSKQFHQAKNNIELKSGKTSEICSHLLNLYDYYTIHSTNRFHYLTEKVSRDIIQCDPTTHELGKTYERLYDFIEYYLTSERFLSENTQCSANEKIYDQVKHNPEVNKYIDDTLLCHGTMYNCKRVDLVHLFLYGQNDIYRRYHAFSLANPEADDNVTVYGEIGNAHLTYTKDDLNGVGENSPESANLHLSQAELENVKNCSIYGCYCDDHDSPRTVRYFSTKLVTSAVENNRVITGLRFVVKERVIYIQIETGQLIGLGIVDPLSVKWKEIEPVSFVGVDEKSASAEVVKLDYHTKSLYLDDVSSDKGFYLTGVKFARARGGVRISAQFTPYEIFDLITYKKTLELAQSDIDRVELELDPNNIPLDMSNLKTIPVSIQNEDFINFQPSDINNDASQTTIPFLDTQPVRSKPPTALGGFGIYVKSGDASGSFVALKLLTPKY